MKNLFFLSFLILSTVFSVSAQWTDDPLTNTIVNDLSGPQAVPHIAYDADGNFYVGFYSNELGNYNIRLQYYNFEGLAQWDEDGLLVSSHTQSSWVTDWDLKTDNTGNCVLAFNDVRYGNADVFAYAISPEGTFLWGEDGITLTTDPESEYVPSITVNSDNNVIVAWSRPTSTYSEIVMQKITPEGILVWGNDGITYQSGSFGYTGARVLGVEGDNYIMAFYKETGSFPALTRHIYVQKFDGDGNPIWFGDALASNSNGISAFNNFIIESDNANGIVIVWTDDRDNDMNIDGSVQRVLSDGSILWLDNGSEVSVDNNYSHQNVRILGVNNNDEVLVCWDKKNSNQSQTAIAGQKFSTSGVQQWTSGGLVFIPQSSNISGSVGGVIFDETNAMVVYDEFVTGMSSNIHAFAVDNDGNMIWSPATTLMAGRTTEKVHIVNSGLFYNQLIVVWEEATTDIYMQNIFTDGSMGIAPVSDDASLSDLRVDDETIEGFDPLVYYYEVDVSEGDDIPLIAGTPNNYFASMEITQAITIPGDATIEVTAQDEITQLTYTVHFNLITGIEYMQKSKVLVFPNPALETVYFSGLNEALKVDIINLLGKIVLTANIENNKGVDIGFLDSGIYFAAFHKKNGEVEMLKFLKK